MKKLGNIKEAYFGLGGPGNSLLGLHLIIGNDSWEQHIRNMSFFDFYKVPHREGTAWDEEYRMSQYASIMLGLSALLENCGASSVEDLKGLDIIAEFKDDKLITWKLFNDR
jgi:hypothetical protein